MTLVKCCGMSRPADLEAVNDARPDFCGFIIEFPSSHRSVSESELLALRPLLDDGIAAVGVFVDADPNRVAAIARTCDLDYVQLHGSEDESYLGTLRQLAGKPIIKAFKATDGAALEQARRSSADHILLDSGKGSGAAFDWGLLEGFERPYFLAGGLTPDTIPEAIERLDPYALDMSSGLETAKRKDPEKISAAVKAARMGRPAV